MGATPNRISQVRGQMQQTIIAARIGMGVFLVKLVETYVEISFPLD